MHAVLLPIVRQYDFNLVHAEKLVEDVRPDQMTRTPTKGLENHPAFTLGHLVSGSALLVGDLGGSPDMPAGWSELFQRNGPGDPRRPDPDPDRYPSKGELLRELERQHGRAKDLMADLDGEALSRPFRWRFSGRMPTLLDLIAFMCVQHEAMHLGQLAAWRRAVGLGSALGAID